MSPMDSASCRSYSSNDSQRRRMAIDSVLNPDDDSATHYQSTVSVGEHSRRSSTSGDSGEGEYRQVVPARSSNNRRPPSRSSTSSQSPNMRTSPMGRERREFRPTYQQEEEYFIWYHRVDLGMDWTDVRQAYNAQFPERQRRGFQGIQCKYYRCCETHGIPRVRERNRGGALDKSYGVRSRLPSLWYSWMRPQNEGKAQRDPFLKSCGTDNLSRLTRCLDGLLVATVGHVWTNQVETYFASFQVLHFPLCSGVEEKDLGMRLFLRNTQSIGGLLVL